MLRRHALAVDSSAILLLALIGALFGTWRAWERATQVAAEKQLMVNHQTIQLADSAVDSGHPLDAFQRLSPFIAESTAAQPEWELLHIFGRILQATDLTQMRGMRELPNAGDILLRDTRERDWLWFGRRSTTQPTIRGWQLERVLAGAVTPDFVLNVDYNRLSCAAAAVRAGQDRVCYFLPAFGPDTTLVLAELRSGKELDRTQVTALTDFASWPGPVMFSPDGQRLVALHSCGRLTLWSLTQDRLELIGDQDLDEVGGYAVRFSPT